MTTERQAFGFLVVALVLASVCTACFGIVLNA